MKNKKVLFGILGGCGCLGVAASAVVIALLVVWRAPSGPFAGDGSLTVVVTSTAGRGEAVAPILVARLEALGVEATADEVSDQRIVLRLEGVSDGMGAMRAVLPERRLGMHLVAADQGPLTGDEATAPAGVTVRREGDQPPLFEGEVLPLLEVLMRAQELPGRLAVTECNAVYDGRPPCVAYLVEDPPGITNADIESAAVENDEYSGSPIVMLTFTPTGAARFAELTGRGVRRKLAIVIDGEVLSAPVILEPITGGRAQITLGAIAQEDQLAEAHGLVAAFATEPLPTPWELAEVR